MIEVLNIPEAQPKKWLEQRWLVAVGVFLIVAFLGVFAFFTSKKGEVNIEAISTLIDLESNGTVSLEKKKEAALFLTGNPDLLRQSVSYFIDDPSIVEQATRSASTSFTQGTRLIAQKRYSEALELAEKSQADLATPQLQCLNLLRILALEDELKLQDHTKTLEALHALKQASPAEVAQTLAFFQSGNIGPEDLFSR